MISIINELSRVPYFSFTFFLSVLSPLLCVQAARVYPEPSARFRACNTLSLPSEILHFMRALRWRSHFDGQNLRICGVRMHCENVSDTIWALGSQHFEFMHMFPFSLSRCAAAAMAAMPAKLMHFLRRKRAREGRWEGARGKSGDNNTKDK